MPHSSVLRLATMAAFLGDLVGAGIAYGNAGEIACKAGHLEQSLHLLDLGLRIATAQQARINVLENHRVRAHLVMRLFGPGSPQLKAVRATLEEGLEETDSEMERMQVQNSLATIALLEDEEREASRLIDANESLVAGNAEYEIYWRWNRSVLCAKRGDEQDSARELGHGLVLARRGENQLAIRQFVEEARLLPEGPRQVLDKIIRRNIFVAPIFEETR